jgi:hypothetical protein
MNLKISLYVYANKSPSTIRKSKRKRNEDPNIQHFLRTRISSKSEGVNRCSDDEADGNVEVTDDYFDTGKNCVVSLKSERVVGMCRCDDG